jgi:hypothetical protein
MLLPQPLQNALFIFQEFSIPLSGVDQPHDEVSSADFAFSLSSAEDAQGPQGSFECLQAAAQG